MVTSSDSSLRHGFATISVPVESVMCRMSLGHVSVSTFLFILLTGQGDRGSTVVKVLCYKSEGRWFDPSWCHCNYSLT